MRPPSALRVLEGVIQRIVKSRIELSQHRNTLKLAIRYVIQLRLHAGRETNIHDVFEPSLEHVANRNTYLGRTKSVTLPLNVVPIHYRRNDRRVRAWTPDPKSFQLANQVRLSETRRWSSELLLARNLTLRQTLITRKRRKYPRILRIRILVPRLQVKRSVAIKQHPSSSRPQPIHSIRRRNSINLNGGALQQSVRHLARNRPIPDQTVQPPLVITQKSTQRVRCPVYRGGTDGLMRLLSVPRPRAVPTWPAAVAVAETPANVRGSLAQRRIRNRRAVRSHVRDEPCTFATKVNAFVKRLCHAHRPIRIEPERTCSLLLQSTRDERRTRTVLALPSLDIGNTITRRFQIANQPRCQLAIRYQRRLIIPRRSRLTLAFRNLDQLGNDRRRVTLFPKMREYLPVLDRDELLDLSFAVHDEPQRNRLHPTGRLPACHLVTHERTQLESNEPVQDATCLLRVHQLIIDRTGVSECTFDRILRYLMEHHAPRRLSRDFQQLREMPRYRLSLTVRVGGEVDLRTVSRTPQARDYLTTICRHDVTRLEIVLNINAECTVRQVADMPYRCLDVVASTKIPLDRPRLRTRLHDHEMLGCFPILR